jgi:hypothetical protein
MKPQDELESLNQADERIPAPLGLDPSGRKATNGRSRVEAAARAEFELRAGRPIGDAEWESTKARLVEFARILRSWHQQTITSSDPAAEAIATSQDLRDAA